MHGLGFVLDLTLTLHTDFHRFFLSLNLFLGSDTFCSNLLVGLGSLASIRINESFVFVRHHVFQGLFYKLNLPDRCLIY